MACVRASFRLKLKDVPLHGWAPCCLLTPPRCALGCSHLLAVVNRAARNPRAHTQCIFVCLGSVVTAPLLLGTRDSQHSMGPAAACPGKCVLQQPGQKLTLATVGWTHVYEVQGPPDAAHELLVTSFLTAVVVGPPVAKKKKKKVSGFLVQVGLRVSRASYANAAAGPAALASC